jgi:hypothetical protein
MFDIRPFTLRYLISPWGYGLPPPPGSTVVDSHRH